MSIFEGIAEVYKYLALEIVKTDIAYIHLHDQEDLYDKHFDFIKNFRGWYHGNLIFAGFPTKEKANYLVDENIVDLVAFGRPLISNPDLAHRLKNDLPITPADRETFFGFFATGYIDYKSFDELNAAK